ncbi:MAG: hypothetical protein ACK51M_06925 [Burkholderiales bacterium]
MCAERRTVRGQAIVELLVAMLALVPLYFGVVWVAKVLDVQQATVAASRALAFECTVRPAACADPAVHPELAEDTRLRFFSSHRLGLRSDGALAAQPNAFWVDRRGDALLERLDDVTVDVVPGRFDSPLGFAGGLGDGFPRAVRVLSELAGPGRFGLEIEGGLVEARVGTRLARNRPGDGWVRSLTAMPVATSARTAILIDAWNASGPYGDEADSVVTRVTEGSRVPGLEPAIAAGWLPVRGLLASGAALGFESRASTLRWHEIVVDLVPADRLGRPADVPPPPASAGDRP